MKALAIIPRPAVITLVLLALAVTLAVPLSANGMYDPKHGRWLQRDPLGVYPNKYGTVRPSRAYVDGANLYQYVRSKPTMLLDPKGMTGEYAGCLTLVKAARVWAEGLLPCVRDIVSHFLDGGGEDINGCPAGCVDALKNDVAQRGWQIMRSEALAKNPCKSGVGTQLRIRRTKAPVNASPPGFSDLGLSLGNFQYSKLKVTGWAKCKKYTSTYVEFGGAAYPSGGGGCYIWAWGAATGWVRDEEIDYDPGAAGGNPLARLMNDCAAFLEDLGIGNAYWIRNCKASRWIEGPVY